MKYKIKIIDENKQKEINIGEDEIIEIKYNIGLAENTDFANNRSSIEMTVTGKVMKPFIIKIYMNRIKKILSI